MEPKRLVFTLIAVSFGVLLLLFRKQCTDYCLREQTKMWGLHFNDWQKRGTEVVVVIIALVSIMFGVICVMGFGRMK